MSIDRPEWVPSTGGAEFTTHVVAGDNKPTSNRPMRPRRRQLTADDYVAGIRNRARTVLAQAITLVESNAPKHTAMSQAVLQELLPQTGQSIRIGITGVPGVGKSTFIEQFGLNLLEQGHRVAVLAIDPTSTVTQGSILGDKTRMEQLSRQENAFIRPTPTGGTLGGVARKSRETMLLCEAFGFDVILVETVGVGQSEVTVRSMVDFFLALMLPGAGDELQGIKKGIIELADALVVNKADGDNRNRARLARADYQNALKFVTPVTSGWRTQVHTCSGLTGEGLPEIWAMIQQFQETTHESGVFARRRQQQRLDWVMLMIEEQLKARFFQDPTVQTYLPTLKAQVVEGSLPATRAVQQLFEVYEDGRR